MGRGMADDFQPFGIPVGHDAQRGIMLDGRGGIHEHAVDLARQGRFREARPNARGHIRHGHGMVESLLATIGKSDYGHKIIINWESESPGRLVRASGIEPLTPTMSR